MSNILYPAQPDLSKVTGTLLQNPTEGQTWYNSSNKHLYYWNNTEWVPLMNGSDYAANWGQIGHGQPLPKPVSEDGYVFEYDECIWSVSPAVVGKFNRFVCFAGNDGIVNMQYKPAGYSMMVDGTANYIIIGIRGNKNRGIVIAPPIPSPTPSPGASSTPTPTVTPTISVTPSVGTSLSPTPTPAATSTPTPTITPSVSAVPPIVVTVSDPEAGTNALALQSYCNIANYSSSNRDSGYNGCAASSITICADGSCAPEPGDSGAGPVMRIKVEGGIAPYTVRLRNFAANTEYDLLNSGFEISTGWSLGTGWSIKTGAPPNSRTGNGYAEFSAPMTTSSITNNIRASVSPGTYVNASCWVNQGANDSGEAGGTVGISWYNSSNVLISTTKGNTVSSTSSNTYRESVISATAPPLAAFASVAVEAFRGGGSTSSVRIDDVYWNVGNAGTAECFYVGGAPIASLPFTGIAKTYSLAASGDSTPIISLNGKCGSGIFSMHGTFDIQVTDSLGTVVTVQKKFDLSRINHYVAPAGGGGGGVGGGGGGGDFDLDLNNNLV